MRHGACCARVWRASGGRRSCPRSSMSVSSWPPPGARCTCRISSCTSSRVHPSPIRCCRACAPVGRRLPWSSCLQNLPPKTTRSSTAFNSSTTFLCRSVTSQGRRPDGPAGPAVRVASARRVKLRSSASERTWIGGPVMTGSHDVIASRRSGLPDRPSRRLSRAARAGVAAGASGVRGAGGGGGSRWSGGAGDGRLRARQLQQVRVPHPHARRREPLHRRRLPEHAPAPRSERGPSEIDESSDTYDTIAWLVAHLPYNNGRVGQWGISYPGFCASAGAIDSHPALKAVSPQAPIADWWRGDDMHRPGAFNLQMAGDRRRARRRRVPERPDPPRALHPADDPAAGSARAARRPSRSRPAR